MTFHSTNPSESLDREAKRRADVVGIFSNDDAIARPIGAALLEQNDEYRCQNGVMEIEGMATLATSPIEEVRP